MIDFLEIKFQLTNFTFLKKKTKIAKVSQLLTEEKSAKSRLKRYQRTIGVIC